MFSAAALAGALGVGAAIGEGGGGGVVGAAFGGGGTRLEVLEVWSGNQFFFLFLGLAVLADHGRGEALADDLRADQLAVHIDLLAVGVARKSNLADARDEQWIDQAEQD